jgi:signal recognition particle receptor subunit beta
VASINYATREISCKIVYYGPGLSGKTTNLQIIHRKIPDKDKSEMVSLATETDRTLFFDFLPLDLGSIKGFATKFQLYTVPGQVYYNATRKLVLRGVDGVVFVVDSQVDKLQENLESFQNLQENLREYGHSIETIPVVLQFNKRDLPNVYPVDQLNSLVNKYGMPYYEAVAATGVGVFTTLKGIGKSVIDKFNAKYSGFQGSRRPAGSPTGGAPNQRAAAPPAPAPAPKPAPQPPAPGFSAPGPGGPGGAFPPGQGFGGFAKPNEAPRQQPAPLSQSPMGAPGQGGFSPFQTPSANPFQTGPVGNQPQQANPFGGAAGGPPGQFIPPTGGPKPFGGFGGPAPQPGPGPSPFSNPQSNPQSQPQPPSPFGNPVGPMGGPQAGSPFGGGRPAAPAAPSPSPFGAPQAQPSPFGSQPNPSGSPFGGGPKPFGGPQPFGAPTGFTGAPNPPSPPPFTPQVETFGTPKPMGQNPPMVGGLQSGPSIPASQSPFGGGGAGAPFGGNQGNPPFGGQGGQGGQPGLPTGYGQPPAAGPSPFGGNAPFGNANPNPGNAPFGSAPLKPFIPSAPPSQSPFGGSPMNTPPAYGSKEGMGGPSYGNPGGPGPNPGFQSHAAGGQPQPNMGGNMGNNSMPPPGGSPFQQGGYTPGLGGGPAPMPPLGDIGDGAGRDDNSGIVSTYEDMQRNENFKTRKLPLPGEKKKGFFDGLFKKDK